MGRSVDSLGELEPAGLEPAQRREPLDQLQDLLPALLQDLELAPLGVAERLLEPVDQEPREVEERGERRAQLLAHRLLHLPAEPRGLLAGRVLAHDLALDDDLLDLRRLRGLELHALLHLPRLLSRLLRLAVGLRLVDRGLLERLHLLGDLRLETLGAALHGVEGLGALDGLGRPAHDRLEPRHLVRGERVGHAIPDRDHSQELVAGQEGEGGHGADAPVLQIRLLDPVVRLHVGHDHGLARGHDGARQSLAPAEPTALDLGPVEAHRGPRHQAGLVRQDEDPDVRPDAADHPAKEARQNAASPERSPVATRPAASSS